VPQKGWLDSISLRAGDKLLLRSGEVVIIEQVQHEILESPETVYNFEVAGLRTYYVSGSSVLVHNNCSKKAPMQERKKIARRSMFKTKKAAKQEALRYAKGKGIIHHHRGKFGPHYHINVKGKKHWHFYYKYITRTKGRR
jgi:hypothetical protein